MSNSYDTMPPSLSLSLSLSLFLFLFKVSSSLYFSEKHCLRHLFLSFYQSSRFLRHCTGKIPVFYLSSPSISHSQKSSNSFLFYFRFSFFHFFLNVIYFQVTSSKIAKRKRSVISNDRGTVTSNQSELINS